MKYLKTLKIVLIISLSGCATINNGKTQPIKIITQNQTNPDTVCTAKNEEGEWRDLRPDVEFTVHRDGNPLVASCENPQQVGTGSAEPAFQSNYLLMDVILVDACIISCIIDGVNNAFYHYDGIVTVPMQTK